MKKKKQKTQKPQGTTTPFLPKLRSPMKSKLYVLACILYAFKT